MILSEFFGKIKGVENPNEFLPEMWEEYGSDMVSRLDGMFCFVLENSLTGETFAARDRFGTRTMYYARNSSGRLICGHSLMDVLHRSGIDPKPNREAVSEYIRMWYPSGRQTLFDGILRLDSGSWLWSHGGELEIRRYFQPSFSERTDIPLQEWAGRIHNAVSSICSEEQCKESFLSSGIDSSYMAAMLPSSKTYTVSFKEKNEMEGVLETASILGIPNTEIIVTKDEFLRYTEEALAKREVPTSDASFIALYIAMKKLGGCRMICSGEGVDELMLGYHYYEASLGDNDGIISRQSNDCTERLGDDLLPSLEAASAASGVEIRMPFLDNRFVDLCMEIPLECKLTRDANKLAFREAALNVLPEEIAFRHKIGFMVPISEWMETEDWKRTIKDAITDGTLESLAGRETVEHCLNEDGWRNKWKAYALVTWYRHFILSRSGN